MENSIFRPLDIASPEIDIDDIDDLVEEYTARSRPSMYFYIPTSCIINISICLFVLV